jgi:starch phosphorylase
MKAAIAGYSATRMVDQYAKSFYVPAGTQYRSLLTGDCRAAAELAAQRERLKSLWANTHIATPTRSSDGPFRVGEGFEVTALVELGELRPEEVQVELYYGKPKGADILSEANVLPMRVLEEIRAGHYRYGATLICEKAGRYGFTTRMSPRGDTWVKNTPGFLTWA